MQMIPNEYRIVKPKRGLRNSLLLFAGLVLVSALVLVIYYYTKVNRAATDESHEIRFAVERGLNTSQIATQLEDQKVISNKNIFIIYSKLHDAGSKIQAGEYTLNSNMTVAEIVDVLTAGRVAATGQNVTIIEGLTNRQIGTYLANRGVIESSAELDQVLANDNFDFKYESTVEEFFTKGGENSGRGYQGFLFPDTYKLSKDNSVPDLVSKMLNNFESKISDKMIADIQSQKRTMGEVLILASIIEKEVGRNKSNITAQDISVMEQERKIVASVFLNRLEVGMALESDATVNFITGKNDRSATIEDTKIKSPYNTYQVRGLPPSPISNPGLNSIEAAIYPAQTDYVYFLNSPEGVAYFARTLAEHNDNRAKYLR